MNRLVVPVRTRALSPWSALGRCGALQQSTWMQFCTRSRVRARKQSKKKAGRDLVLRGSSSLETRNELREETSTLAEGDATPIRLLKKRKPRPRQIYSDKELREWEKEEGLLHAMAELDRDILEDELSAMKLMRTREWRQYMRDISDAKLLVQFRSLGSGSSLNYTKEELEQMNLNREMAVERVKKLYEERLPAGPVQCMELMSRQEEREYVHAETREQRSYLLSRLVKFTWLFERHQRTVLTAGERVWVQLMQEDLEKYGCVRSPWLRDPREAAERNEEIEGSEEGRPSVLSSIQRVVPRQSDVSVRRRKRLRLEQYQGS